MQLTEPDADGSVTVTGTYADRFEPAQLDGWRFAERRFGLGRTGVLDHHLTLEP